jgi:hypothetical protein
MESTVAGYPILVLILWALAVGVGVVYAASLYIGLLRGMVPWWHPVVARLASQSVPILVGGWAARVTARRVTGRGRWLIVVAVVAVMAGTAWLGSRFSRQLLPDVITAVQ